MPYFPFTSLTTDHYFFNYSPLLTIGYVVLSNCFVFVQSHDNTSGTFSQFGRQFVMEKFCNFIFVTYSPIEIKLGLYLFAVPSFCSSFGGFQPAPGLSTLHRSYWPLANLPGRCGAKWCCGFSPSWRHSSWRRLRTWKLTLSHSFAYKYVGLNFKSSVKAEILLLKFLPVGWLYTYEQIPYIEELSSYSKQFESVPSPEPVSLGSCQWSLIQRIASPDKWPVAKAESISSQHHDGLWRDDRPLHARWEVQMANLNGANLGQDVNISGHSNSLFWPLVNHRIQKLVFVSWDWLNPSLKRRSSSMLTSCHTYLDFRALLEDNCFASSVALYFKSMMPQLSVVRNEWCTNVQRRIIKQWQTFTNRELIKAARPWAGCWIFLTS